MEIRPDGNYDIQQKRLCNLSEPENEGDAVSKKYLIDNTPIQLKDSYSSRQYRVQDVAYPGAVGDAVNFLTLKNAVINNKKAGVFNARNKRMANMGGPLEDIDATTKRFVQSVSLKRTVDNIDYDVGGKRLRNVESPILPDDVVTQGYMKTVVPIKSEENWDFGKRRLSGVSAPHYDGEAVNLQYFRKSALHKDLMGGSSVFNALHTRIENVAQPVNKENAVTKSYVDKGVDSINRTIEDHRVDRDILKQLKPKLEADMALNKKYFEKRLNKFGTYLYNYIQGLHTEGRSANIAPMANEDYINWEELFKPSDVSKTL